LVSDRKRRCPTTPSSCHGFHANSPPKLPPAFLPHPKRKPATFPLGSTESIVSPLLFSHPRLRCLILLLFEAFIVRRFCPIPLTLRLLNVFLKPFPRLRYLPNFHQHDVRSSALTYRSSPFPSPPVCSPSLLTMSSLVDGPLFLVPPISFFFFLCARVFFPNAPLSRKKKGTLNPPAAPRLPFSLKENSPLSGRTRLDSPLPHP